MRHYILLVALFALTACGSRGNLVLPPGPAPAPILERLPSAKPAPKQEAPADAAARGDLNTATEAAK